MQRNYANDAIEARRPSTPRAYPEQSVMLNQ